MLKQFRRAAFHGTRRETEALYTRVKILREQIAHARRAVEDPT